jgi:hypothetical protein
MTGVTRHNNGIINVRYQCKAHAVAPRWGQLSVDCYGVVGVALADIVSCVLESVDQWVWLPVNRRLMGKGCH